MVRTKTEDEVFTIGYEGHSIESFLSEVSEAEIECLVDVRELPLSRKKGFSKTALSEQLASVGIEYRHVKPLGNPKANRDRYRSGDVVGGADAYRVHLSNGSHQSLVELAEQIESSRICLLCFERDHKICHRDVIVEALRDLTTRLMVTHL